MDNKQFDLYLDESGNFDSDDFSKNRNPSLVGGVLCPTPVMTPSTINRLIDHTIHANKAYDKERFFGIIDSLLNLGGRIVIFENNERVHILDADTTYLNIITEGLTKLLRDLHNEMPQANIRINILIATRQNSAERDKGNLIRIMSDEYLKRIEEKMYVALGRNKIDHVTFEISYDNALKNKRLMFADIICNTWLTRKARVRFTEEDREWILAHFANSIRYEIYEDQDAAYLRRLISENRIGEAIAQLCAHQKMTRALLDVKEIILNRIISEYAKDRELYFSYISLKIGQFNRRRDFDAGIKFAEQYETQILLHLLEQKDTHASTAYWMFDTDFYLLTMYDHLGNADKCTEYADRCNNNISAVNRSWEHIDYYFNFRIRELNRKIGRFEFEDVLKESEPLIDQLQSAKELFAMIDPEAENSAALRSDLLGKVYGVRLEAYINLLYDKPEYYDKALETSDLAIAEFSKLYDIKRQYQYRCLLYVTAEKVEEALEALLQSYDLEYAEGVFNQFIDKVFAVDTKSDAFALFHFTNVMLLMKQKKDSHAEDMMVALMTSRRFSTEAANPIEDDYPWNLILWNLGRYWRFDSNSKKAAEEYISRALSLTVKHTSEKTMYSFAVCIAADSLYWAKKNALSNERIAQKEFDTVYNKFLQMNPPMAMKKRLQVETHGQSNSQRLEHICKSILK
ncbi:MAG: DUF3800 domain-containing protein [Clostridia bacterium]|nr:DUF3800 domain-containing protein [Clostridia bacterium]